MFFRLFFVLFTVIHAHYYLQLCYFFIHFIFNLIHPYFNHDDTSFRLYSIYTVMVFDNWRNGIPIAFFVNLRTCEQNFRHIFLALHHMIENINSDYNQSGIIVDNAQAKLVCLGKPICLLFIVTFKAQWYLYLLEWYCNFSVLYNHYSCEITIIRWDFFFFGYCPHSSCVLWYFHNMV